MKVVNCVVDDGTGNELKLTDDRGFMIHTVLRLRQSPFQLLK